MDSTKDYTLEFEESLRRHSLYPTNIVRMQAFIHTADRYRQSLQQKQVFHETHRSLYLLDLLPDNGDTQGFKFKDYQINTSDILTNYLAKTPSPTWRFIFLQALSSRSPLGCSKDQLTTLLTHHQVMPSITDMIMAFKPRSKPISHAMFRHESHLQPDSLQFPLPGLGRSGIQFQTAFSLLSVEQASAPGELNPWPLRQTALYHSFDVVTGQTLFIVLKADINILKRINLETKRNRETQPSSLLIPRKSFTATLLTQLIAIEWCEENWSDYIEYFEEKVREKSIEGKLAPISDATSTAAIEMSVSRRSTQNSPVVSRRGTLARSSTIWAQEAEAAPSQPLSVDATIPETDGFELESYPASPTKEMPSPIRRTSSLRKTVIEMFGRSSSTHSRNSKHGDLELGNQGSQGIKLSGFDPDKSLSFDEFQRMDRWSEELEQSIKAIEENHRILSQLQEHYGEITKSHGFMEHIDAPDVSSKLKMFMTRIDGIMRDLHIHRDRLRAIARTLENDKALYLAASQYKSARMSEHFAYTAKLSADRMEDWTRQMHSIAIKTEHETVSMHVITIFTLIFLPGTFIATFFSSGAIRWDDDGSLGTDYVARPGGMRLFFATIIPLTVVIMIVWGLIYWVARRRRKNTPDDVLPIQERR